jgi:hypothetical protein
MHLLQNSGEERKAEEGEREEEGHEDGVLVCDQ